MSVFSQIAAVFSDIVVQLSSGDKVALVHPVNADGTSGIDVDIMSPNIDASCYIGKSTGTNGGDFVVTYTAATQLTLSSFPGSITALYAADIESIRQINAAGAVVATYHRDDVTMLMAGAVLTVTGAAFTATDKFIVFTNIPRPTASGSGGAGGGTIVYSNMSGDFVATPTNGAATITITGLPFTLEAVHVAAGSIKKIAVTTNIVTSLTPSSISVAGGVITLGGITNFATGDLVAVTLIGPDKAYDTSLDTQLVTTQNPDYAHTTSVETLIDEADIVGSAATGDAGGDTDDIVDADGAFTVASHAVGYRAWQTADAQSALITAVDSTTNISTDVLSGAATWASKAYRLPLVKRYEINMDTYNFLTLHYYLRNGASLNTYLLLYGTLNAAATVDADTGWVNLSESHLGSASGINCPASTTLEDIIILDTPQTMLKYMVKLVVECSIASAPDNDYELYIKKSS